MPPPPLSAGRRPPRPEAQLEGQSPAASRRAALAAALAVLAVAGWATSAGAGTATAATMATIHGSFLPDRLGARTALTVAMRFSGGEEGIPSPLRGMVLRLPAGLVLDLRGVTRCAPARLRRGVRGCPRSALVGRGRAVLEVKAGSQTIPEESVISILRGPDRRGGPTLQIFGQGETPLYQSATSTALVQRDAPPFGLKLAVSVPRIPTITFEPDASFTALSLTLGGLGRSPRAHAAGTLREPRRCPSGGFPLAASFSFADGSRAQAAARIPCP
jgi:hypothetical protein